MENNMGGTDETKSKVQSLTESVSEYIQIYLKLGAVNATEKATVVATIALTASLLSLFLLFILFFTGIGLAIWLGEALGNLKAGYFIVAGCYILFVILFVSFRKRFIFPFVRDHIIQKVYE